MTKGIITLVVITLIGVSIYWLSRPSEKIFKLEITTESAMTESSSIAQDTIQETGEHMTKVLAGKSAPLIDFTKTDYEEAKASGKLIALYFYANWCPVCKAEFPEAVKAFDALTTDQVIGFRVNFNDSDTDSDEVALARQFGVAYQHTKVFLKDDKVVLKSPESWDTARYVDEINKALN